MSVEVIDFGCRLNLAEGAAIAAHMANHDAQVVVNTCAVTSEAVRQARQAIRRISRERPGMPITVTGCAVHADAAKFSAMPQVTRVVQKELLRGPKPAVSGIGHARAFIEIQNGCDHSCTFCVTTLARGFSRSMAATDVIEAANAAVARGQQEVVLTGVDATSYRPSLAHLIKSILREVHDLPRLRLSSLDPAEIDDDLFDLLVSEPRIMPHVHLSLQSGDPMILKRMKRRHTPEQAVDLVKRLNSARPDIAIGADFIAGFPTETDAMHANSLAALDTCDIMFAHIFPYSPRPGTAAAKMPQTPVPVARARAAELRDAANNRQSAWMNTLVGETLSVLVERSRRVGHAANFATVDLMSPLPAGAVVDIKITGHKMGRLEGVPA